MIKFANIISVLFHPLLMMTYGVLIALSYTYLALYPFILKLYIVGGVLLCTVLVPSAVVVLMVKSGKAGDMELSRKHERLIPYLVFMAGNMACFFFYYKLQMPAWLLSMFIGVSFALLFALCINFIWKISAHAMGIGGLLGAIMGSAYIQSINPYHLFILLILVAGIIGTARIILEKHTPMQVLCGSLLGFACTFVSSLMNISYFFIQ
jgi:membrane-associated phospholipid phosphatase